jgi:hypothetical protein
MLADEIVANGVPGTGCSPTLMRPTIARIVKAQKYVLAPQFAAVADALSSNYGSLVKAFPFCRLPYPEVWIELAAADRPNFIAAELQAPGFQGRPKRVGFLCSAKRSDLAAWRTHLFWNLQSPPERMTLSGRTIPQELVHTGAGGAAMAIDFDMLNVLDPITEAQLLARPPRQHGLRPDVFVDIPDHPGWERAAAGIKLAMLRHTHPAPADYGLPSVENYLTDRGQIREAYELIAQLARSDWAGEVAFLLAVIGLMNARNASETTPSNLAKLNRARAKRREPPLFEHHVLKIHSRQQHRAAADGPQSSHAPMRGHFVSGHWKVRRTGIFFWHPFRRGDFSRGTVSKDYQLDH